MTRYDMTHCGYDQRCAKERVFVVYSCSGVLSRLRNTDQKILIRGNMKRKNQGIGIELN